MNIKRIATSGLEASLMLADSVWLGVGEKEEKTEKLSQVIVGTFDSRAVKLAYDTAVFSGRMPDLKVPKSIEFRQGFGTGDVSEYLDQIRDEIPKIAEKTGFNITVSKWEFDYRAPEAEVVDITDPMIASFNPSQRVLDIVRDMKDIAPLSEKEAACAE